ncbi:MAG: hypothetical protein PHT95_08090 [Candidatus Omnitrophica bacterium]|nr:hypothetical protein [Candidatus Omnitrophota bacterium]
MGARRVDMPPDYSGDPLEEGFRILARIILRKMREDRARKALDEVREAEGYVMEPACGHQPS